MARPRSFSGGDTAAEADIADDETLLTLVQAEVRLASRCFEVIDFAKANKDGDTDANVSFLAQRAMAHWQRARDVLAERRRLDGQTARPRVHAEAAAAH